MQATEASIHGCAGWRDPAVDVSQPSERPVSPAWSQRQGAPPPPPPLQQPPSCSGIGHEFVTTWSHPPPFGPGQPQRPTAGHYFQDNPRRFGPDYSAFPTTFPSGHVPIRRSSRPFAETYDQSDHHVRPSHGTTRDFRGDTRTFSRSRSRSTDRHRERSRSPISFSSRRRSTSRSPSEASFSSRPSTDEDSLSISQRASVAFTEVGKLLQFPPPSPSEPSWPSYHRERSAPKPRPPSFPSDRTCVDIMNGAFRQVPKKKTGTPAVEDKYIEPVLHQSTRF